MAFTLAEVLITLGVIGVVAALTMPSLIENHREKVTIVKLQQVYNLLQQATQRMIQDEGDRTINYFGADPEERINKYVELLPKYLNVVKVCPVGERSCVPFEYKGVGYTWSNNWRNIYLNNGSLLAIHNNGSSCLQDVSLQKTFCKEGIEPCYPLNYGTYFQGCATIWVDLNGKKGPNISGKDFFEFVLVQDGIVPTGLPQETIWVRQLEERCLKQEYKGGCSGWIIHNKNMDYLRCPDKLGWNKASSCKD